MNKNLYFFKYALRRYNEERCCAMIAKIFLAASPVTEYKEFMETWNIGTPESTELISLKF